jgi:hypothetical protein
LALLAPPTAFPTSPNTITVCSAGAGASFHVTFSNALGQRQMPQLTGGPSPYSLAVGAGACATVWTKAIATTLPLDVSTAATVIQIGQDAGFTFGMVEAAGLDPLTVANNATKTATLHANAFHGATATFTQVAAPQIAVCDFVTFGGDVLEPNRVSYGGNAGATVRAVLFGELNFKNHTNGDHVHVHDIGVYAKPTSGPLSQFDETRHIEGTATINGEGAHKVTVRLTDRGEPGGADWVYMVVDGNVTIPAQNIVNGNIQLHHVCRPAPRR